MTGVGVVGGLGGGGRFRVSLACPDSEWLDPRRNVFELGGKLPPAVRTGLVGTLRGAARAWKIASGDSPVLTGLLRRWASVSLRVHDFRR